MNKRYSFLNNEKDSPKLGYNSKKQLDINPKSKTSHWNRTKGLFAPMFVVTPPQPNIQFAVCKAMFRRTGTNILKLLVLNTSCGTWQGMYDMGIFVPETLKEYWYSRNFVHNYKFGLYMWTLFGVVNQRDRVREILKYLWLEPVS